MLGETFVVVGAGQAGLQVCTTLRGEGFEGRLVLIGDEDSLPYQRPPLSKEFLLGALEPARLLYRNKEYFEKLDVELMLNDAVTKIDRFRHVLSLSSGNVLKYSKLALTTGSRVRILECEGGDLPDIFYIRSLADSTKLRERMRTAQSIVVVGGGFVGLEAGAIARKMGKSVTILESQERLMRRAISQELSEYYLSKHVLMGANVRLECDVSHFEKLQNSLGVVLKTGESITTDIVVIGIGVVPNSEIAESAGLECSNGIRVNQKCLTSDVDIVAAGDCTMHQNHFLKKIIRLESVQNAVDQAKVAASSMIGDDRVYNEVPWFWSDQYDVKLQIAGVTDGHNNHLHLCGQNENSFSLLYFKADELLGADSINQPVVHMAVRKILRKGLGANSGVLKGMTVAEIIAFSKTESNIQS
jgi:3-phenylpropionate/trans-cinnamate dioxygenase ferredoxin reductase component